MFTVEKRFTIFISSTFLDLQEERNELIYAAVRQNAAVKCMEFFPAQYRRKWDVIREAIDESDIYVLLVGGRYGSIEEDSGLSYTEKEFIYAQNAGKYVIVFINPKYQELEAYKSDENRSKLDEFIKKIQDQPQILPAYWQNKQDISENFASAYNACIKDARMKEKGWIRAAFFSGFLDLISLSQDDNFDKNSVGISRLNSKVKAIEEAKTIDIAVHTGCFYFSHIGYNKTVYQHLIHNLEKGVLKKLRVVLFHPYTLNGILLAREGEGEALQANLINSVLNKIIMAYPEVIDEVIKETLTDVVSEKSYTDYYTKFRLAYKGIQNLIDKFPKQVQLRLLPTEMTLSLLTTDTECFIEPYAAPMSGDKEAKTFELHVSSNSQLYRNMQTHFDYLWNISNEYDSTAIDDIKQFYLNRFKKN